MCKKIIFVFFTLIIAFVSVIIFRMESTEKALASSVIRLHVIANSDSEYDQNLKLIVKDRIISEMSDIIDENGDIYTAGENIINSIENIKLIAKEELSKHNCNYNVNVSFGKSDFPTKDYGNFVLPAGRYNALKVEIGKASGQNWWCVLFPPLCFVDAGTITSSGRLTDDIEKNIGSDRMYLIDKSSSSETKVKFKTYEMWQKSKQKLAMLFE